jgi:hypothetical protein
MQLKYSYGLYHSWPLTKGYRQLSGLMVIEA